MNYTTKSTGKPFREFATGSRRDSDEGKPRPGLISPYFLRRLGGLLARGAEKYGKRNWEKGQPFQELVESLYRHLLAFECGEKDEDHLAAIGFGVMCLIHEEECIAMGILPESLDDMPDYEGQAQTEDCRRETDQEMAEMLACSEIEGDDWRAYDGADIIIDSDGEIEEDLDDMVTRTPVDVYIDNMRVHALSDQEIADLRRENYRLYGETRNPDGDYD